MLVCDEPAHKGGRAQGVVTLLADFVVCKEGDVLTPQQAALLRVFEVKMAVFKMSLIGRWTAQGLYMHFEDMFE